MKKKMFPMLVLMLLLLSVLPINSSNADPEGGDWIIDGDTIYVDNADVYLSATPHTIGDSGWINFELESKTHSGNIDCVLGFNSEEAKPSHAEIWKNYTHTLKGYHYEDKIFYISFYDCVDYEILGIENYDLYDVDIGNKNNTKLWRLTYNVNQSVIIAFTSKEVDGTTIHFTYIEERYVPYTYESTFFDWKPLGKTWEKDTHNYQGFDKWYSLKDVNVEEDKLYQMRVWVNIPFKGLQGSIGKYWWSVKPSGKTVQEAIADGQFYCLDPWWNSSWDYYRTITIDQSYIDNSVQGIPLLVVVNKTIGADCDGGDSIRFLSVDNTTQFSYEIEGNWSSTGNSYVWVNISEQIPTGSDYVFNMYYDNPLAPDNSTTGADVWDINYTAVYHLNASNPVDNRDSSQYENHVVAVNNTPHRVAGKVGYGVYLDSNDQECLNITSSPSLILDGADGFTVEAWFETSLVSAQNHYLVSKVGSGTNSDEWFIRRTSDATKSVNFRVYDESTDGFYDLINNEIVTNQGLFNHWIATFDGHTGGGTGHQRNFFNRTKLTTIASESGSGTFVRVRDTGAQLTIGRSLSDPVYTHNGTVDEVRISNIERNSTWRNLTYLCMNNTPNFMTMSPPIAEGDILPPTTFTTTAIAADYINITWTNSVGVDYTYIRYSKTGYPTTRTDGTFLCNATNSSYNMRGLSVDESSTYYFTAWGYKKINNAYSNLTITDTATTWSKTPGVPTSVIAVLVTQTDLDITWVKGSYADDTVIVKKSGSYPTSPSDGTVIYNGAGTNYLDAGVGVDDYYAMYSLNNTYGLYSSIFELRWGGLKVNAHYYNSTINTTTNLTFNLFITNHSGTETYTANGCTNPKLVSVSDIPTGENVGIRVSNNETWWAGTGVNSTGNISIYRSRWYYKDIDLNYLHTINTYLPLVNDTELYLITVLNEYGQPLPMTKVTFKEIIAGELVEVSTLLTDGAGQCEIYLEADRFYKIIISKDGYTTGYSDYTPSDSVFTHTFRIYPTGTPGANPEKLWDGITWSILPTGIYHTTNVTIVFTVTDSNNTLEYFRMNVTRHNSTTDSWEVLYFYNDTTHPGGGSITFTTPNVTGKYAVECTFKKEGFDEYTFGVGGICRLFYIYWLDVQDDLELIPSVVYIFITIFLVIAAMGMLIRLGAADAAGFVGLIVMGIMFALRPSLMIAGVSCWFILIACGIAYACLMFILYGR